MPKWIGASGGFHSIVYNVGYYNNAHVLLFVNLSAAQHYLAADPWPLRTSTAAPYCILEFGFGFLPIGDFREDQYGCRLPWNLSELFVISKRAIITAQVTGPD